MDDDVDFLGVAGEGLVDGVVYYFVDKVVQAHFAGRADVHGRTKANCLEAFEDFDVFAGVISIAFGERSYVAWFSRHSFPFAESSPLAVTCLRPGPEQISGLKFGD